MRPLPKPLRYTANPVRHVYDVIVVGGQLAGALAAGLLTKRGYRVLWVEHDGTDQGYENQGWLLPYAPFLMPSLRSMPEVENAFTELSLTTTVQRMIRPHQPMLQLIYPEARVDLHQDDSKRLREIKREFPSEAEAFQKQLQGVTAQGELTDPFFRQRPPLPPAGFLDQWKLKRAIRNHPALSAASPLAKDTPLPSLLSALTGFLNYTSPEEGLAATRPLSQIVRTPQRFPGGREGLRELLLKRLVELGGDVLDQAFSSTVVEELTFEGRKLVGARVVQSDHLFRASCFIASTDAAALRRLLPDKKKQRRLAAALDLSETKEILFPINWVVPQSSLPLGLGELLLVQDDAPELNPMLIQLTPARQANGKEEEQVRTVTAAAFVPASARELGEKHLFELASRLNDKLDALFPFIREKALSRSAPYLDASGVRGSRLLPHPHWIVHTNQFLGVTGLSQSTPLKNLILASREVLPGLGVEGEFLAGIRAARLVQERLHKRDPLKR